VSRSGWLFVSPVDFLGIFPFFYFVVSCVPEFFVKSVRTFFFCRISQKAERWMFHLPTACHWVAELASSPIRSIMPAVSSSTFVQFGPTVHFGALHGFPPFPTDTGYTHVQNWYHPPFATWAAAAPFSFGRTATLREVKTSPSSPMVKKLLQFPFPPDALLPRPLLLKFCFPGLSVTRLPIFVDVPHTPQDSPQFVSL